MNEPSTGCITPGYIDLFRSVHFVASRLQYWICYPASHVNLLFTFSVLIQQVCGVLIQTFLAAGLTEWTMPAETPYWPKWFVLRPPWLPPSAAYGLYVGLFWNGCDRLRMIQSMRYLVILSFCCRVRVGSAPRNQNGKSVEGLVDI